MFVELSCLNQDDEFDDQGVAAQEDLNQSG